MNKTNSLFFLAAFGLSLHANAQPPAYGWSTAQPQQPQTYQAQAPSPVPTPAPVVTAKQSPEAKAFYNQNGRQFQWVGSPENDRRLRQFMAFLPAIEKHGLRLADYKFQALTQILNSSPEAFEIEFTNEVLRLLKGVNRGRLDDPRIVSNKDVKFMPRTFAIDASIMNFFAGPSAYTFAAVAPQHEMYRDLMELLARLKAINLRGGYAGIQSLPATFKVGTIDPIVAEMKAILNVYGFNLVVDSNFDEPLKAALQKMQEANLGLPDGIVSPRNKDVLEFFKVDSFAREREVEMVMEQIRWLPPYLGDRYLFLNSAIQELTLHDPNLEVSSPLRLQKTVNGKPDRQTPSLEDYITQVVLNPTWTPAETSLAKDKIPAMRTKFLEQGVEGVVSYLQSMRFTLYDRRTNQMIDPYYDVDWATITAEGYPVSSLPFKLVQSTGADNALGSYKFHMANGFAIYLHDTNERDLFGKDSLGRYIYNNRLLSSGCVRVEHPEELARYLLQGTKWTPEMIAATVKKGRSSSGAVEPTGIVLSGPQRMKVYLLPMTAYKKDGVFFFAKDAYKQNARIENALKYSNYLKEAAVPATTTSNGIY